jgi:hypothetical protein
MAFRFFFVSVRDDGTAAAGLNGFLRSHKVLTVDRRRVDQGAESFWSFCVDYLESAGGSSSEGKNGPVRGKVDYRDELSPEDFAVFARLRQLRKEIAQSEAVPVYTVFTSEQLAQMVQSRATTRAALEKIAGIGDARIEKYGPRVLGFFQGQWDGKRSDAMRRADRFPVPAPPARANSHLWSPGAGSASRMLRVAISLNEPDQGQGSVV